MRIIAKNLILASLLISIVLLAAGSLNAAPLYFPHVDTNPPWQTEIAIINTSNQAVTGTLRALSNAGQPVDTKAVTLSANGRRQITIADEFANHTSIGYIIFDTNSDAVQGYTKFYQAGIYRAAIPAVKEVNTSDITISHIDSSALWWTGVSLVNTTATPKDLTITFNTGQSKPISLAANEHRAFDIASLFNNQPQPDIKSAVITNASGVIGLELFGSKGSGNQLDGLLLSGNTASTIYYPHVASDNIWWTGIVAYNPSSAAATLTVTPYSAQGTALPTSTLSIAGKGKYVGLVSDLGLPSQTAWLKIDSSSPITGFELFATWNGDQLAAYAGGGGTGGKTGVFAKIEKSGWTGIAFVNTEADAASVTLTAYNDAGTAVATQVLPVGGHEKVVKYAEAIFSQSISSATYVTYSSDRNVVGFQLNGSSDGMMLDGLPALAGPTKAVPEITEALSITPSTDPHGKYKSTASFTFKETGGIFGYTLTSFQIIYRDQNGALTGISNTWDAQNIGLALGNSGRIAAGGTRSNWTVSMFWNPPLTALRTDWQATVREDTGVMSTLQGSESANMPDKNYATIGELAADKTTPEALRAWMSQNLTYLTVSNMSLWKYLSPQEVFAGRQGDCIHQSAFAKEVLIKNGYACKLLFVLRFYSPTHAVCYWPDANGKLWWLENTFDGHKGINGPFSNEHDMAEQILEWLIAKNPGEPTTAKYGNFDTLPYGIGWLDFYQPFVNGPTVP